MIDWSYFASICFGDQPVGGWTLNFAVTVPLALSLVLYCTGVSRLWRSAGVGHGTKTYEVLAFLGGWLLLSIALVTPLHDLSRRLFAAHMIEHELVMTLAAPLLVMARPLGPLVWALPKAWRATVARGTRTAAYLLGWDILTVPLVAALVHAAAIWIWHIPFLYEAALHVEWEHWAQHLSFLVSALFFWWTVLDFRSRVFSHGTALFTLFATALHTGFLGILITFAPRPIYPTQSQIADDWGLTALSDQQLAGLVMWVPGGLAYAVAALAVAGLWIARSSALSAAPAILNGSSNE